MMDRWRLIMHPPRQGSVNMAVDYAILKSVASGTAPTLRLYRWHPPAITLGYFQIRDEETYYDACREDGIPVIRRITGGGAVYHENEITYSIAIPVSDPRLTGTIMDSYRLILQPVIDTLCDYGIPAAFKPINDILVEDRKISGSAQTRRHGVLLQHGTLLVTADKARMFRYLKISAGKLQQRGIDDAASGITALDEWIAGDVNSDEFISQLMDRMAENFGRIFAVNLIQGELTEKEHDESVQIEKELFLYENWNNKRKNELDF